MNRPIYTDPAKPIKDRAADLISRMTVEEKASQLLYASPAVERLGIPEYNWWSECLHGIARNGRATVFPQAIGLAAAFDEDLVLRVASAVSDEGRAKYNIARKKNPGGGTGQNQGLTFWTPNINIFRDPRWGRGQETYGEDPFLTGRIGTAFVRGLQGDDPKYMKAAACAKHFAVHSGPEKDRHTFNALVGERDLWETYLPAFRTLVENGVEAVMGAYNRTNHEPCCASRMLLADILRERWKFAGHVVSDCWAVRDFHENHKVTSGPADSAALALKTGCDLNCGCTYEYVLQALEEGKISEDDIDRSLTRLLRTRFKLGMFDPEENVPYSKIGPEVICCSKHRDLAREAAEKSIVLLKNRGGILPLDKERGSYYITGPNAADVNMLLGNYCGLNDRLVTPLEGIIGAAKPGLTFNYRKGVLLNRPNPNPVEWAVSEAEHADAVIAVMGLSPDLEGEEGDAIDSTEKGDRADIMLPENQLEYLRKLYKTGTPVILVLCGGSPIALGDIAELVDAVLFVWIPGEAGGTALGNVLFGNTAPSGKLPLTFPRSTEDLPPYDDYSMEGRTYKYIKNEPLYPFGFGLSYTTFTYKDLTLSSSCIETGASLQCSVKVGNTGPVKAEEAVQIYISDIEASVRVPKYRLCGFKRVSLSPGQFETVTFRISPEMMRVISEEGKEFLEAGTFRLTAGGASPGERSRELGAPEPVSAVFEVVPAVC